MPEPTNDVYLLTDEAGEAHAFAVRESDGDQPALIEGFSGENALQRAILHAQFGPEDPNPGVDDDGEVVLADPNTLYAKLADLARTNYQLRQEIEGLKHANALGDRVLRAQEVAHAVKLNAHRDEIYLKNTRIDLLTDLVVEVVREHRLTERFSDYYAAGEVVNRLYREGKGNLALLLSEIYDQQQADVLAEYERVDDE